MSELKCFIDETFNNLKSKIEEEYNTKIKDHFTKISIDVCNDSYSKDEYGKIDIGKIKHPEGRYIIHKIEFNIENTLTQAEQHDLNSGSQVYKYFGKIKLNGTLLIDNFGERYIFDTYISTYGNGGQSKKYRAFSPNTKMPIGHRPDFSTNEILFNYEFQLIPSKNEYEYPLTNRIIDFVKSQNFPIENLDTLSKIMASIEIYKKTYNKKEYDDLDNLTDELNDKNEELTSKLNEQVEITNKLLKKYNEQLKINEELSKEIKTQKELNDDICKKMFDMKEQLFTLETKN
jgi:hypothetical protein